MIEDEQVDTALEYLNDARAIAIAHFNAMRAKNALNRIAARLFLEYSGTIKEREAQAEITDEYQNAQTQYEQAVLTLEETKARIEGGRSIIDVWRTYNANARRVEQVR